MQAGSVEPPVLANSELSRGTIRAAVFVCLWFATLGSGLAVVFTTYKTRLNVQALEGLRHEAIALKVSGGQYQLELSSLASYPRIEGLALDRLEMAVPQAKATVIVK